jgi:hypothetical protein
VVQVEKFTDKKLQQEDEDKQRIPNVLELFVFQAFYHLEEHN